MKSDINKRYTARKDSIDIINDKDSNKKSRIKFQRLVGRDNAFNYFQKGDYWNRPENIKNQFPLFDDNINKTTVIEQSRKNIQNLENLFLEQIHKNKNKNGNNELIKLMHLLSLDLENQPYILSHYTTKKMFKLLKNRPTLYSCENLHNIQAKTKFNKFESNSKSDLWMNNTDFVFFYVDYQVPMIREESRYGSFILSCDASKTAFYDSGLIMMDDNIDNAIPRSFANTTRKLQELQVMNNNLIGPKKNFYNKTNYIKCSDNLYKEKSNSNFFEIGKKHTKVTTEMFELQTKSDSKIYDSRYGYFVGEDIKKGLSLWVAIEMMLFGIENFSELLKNAYPSQKKFENMSEKEKNQHIISVNQIMKTVIRPQGMIAQSVSLKEFNVSTTINIPMNNYVKLYQLDDLTE